MKVPWDKQVLLADSVLFQLLSPDVNELVPPLVNTNPLTPLFLQAMKGLFDKGSSIAYGQAYDPPDTDYTEIVIPSAQDLPTLESAPDSPLKAFVLTLDTIESLKQAEATSRDRSQGAAAAQDFLWESKQLSAAAAFGIQASYSENQLINLATQLAAAGVFNNPPPTRQP